MGTCSHERATARMEVGHQQRSTAPVVTQSSWDTIIHPTPISCWGVPLAKSNLKPEDKKVCMGYLGEPTSGTHTQERRVEGGPAGAHFSLLPSEKWKYIILQLTADTL